MVTAVYLNPCIDQTLEIERFTQGGMNRVLCARKTPGGKSVNVSLVLRKLGLDVRCAGMLFKENGIQIVQQLQKAGVLCDVLWRDGTVRVNTKLFERSSGTTSEINEPGNPWNAEDTEEMTALVKRNAAQSEYVVLTGSLPPSCPSDYYGELIQACERDKCVLDAEGAALL